MNKWIAAIKRSDQVRVSLRVQVSQNDGNGNLVPIEITEANYEEYIKVKMTSLEYNEARGFFELHDLIRKASYAVEQRL